MAQTGYTPIQLYYSTTAAAQPTAGNLLDGELALNIPDGKLYYKDGSTVKLLASASGVTGPSSSTANGIALFDGTTGNLLKDSASTDGLIYGLTVGRGAGAEATNTAVGASALANNTTGSLNTAVGYQASFSNTIGANNTSVGYQAGYTNTTGSQNTYLGRQAGYLNDTASQNTAIGYQAAYANTAGSGLTAVGRTALNANTTGTANTALGSATLQVNTIGSYNVAVGFGALVANTTASYNTAVGYQAGYSNTTGAVNVIVGRQAGFSNTTASGNTFVGDSAGYSNTTNGGNCYVGPQAGYYATGIANTYVGALIPGSTSGVGNAMTTGSKNTIIGGFSGNQNGLDIRTASNYIVLSDGDGNPRGYWDNNGTFTLTVDYKEQVYTANSSTAITLSLANGSLQIITLTGSATITMPTAVAGKSFTLLLKTGAGGYGVVWSTVNWPSGTAPTITTTASKMDKFVFTSDGTNWYGSVAGQAYSV